MGRKERKEIIKNIEKIRNSKVLIYFCGDRPILTANIAPDSVRWMYEHLLSMNDGKPIDHLDFYLYSRGGALEAPWQIITMLRQFCKTLHVLIPYKAYSATTLIALGADAIFMGKKGELGPIDPQMNAQQIGKGPPGSSPVQRMMSVEDVTSYISFIKEKVGITDQNALSELTKSLADSLTPTTLGQINRTHSHIRLVAGKMLSLVKPSMDNVKIHEIVESLTEKIYVHGHSIGREEAKQIRMQVQDMDDDLEKLCWDLFLDYETEMKLNSPAMVLAYFTDSEDEYREDKALIACIESIARYHECSGPVVLKKTRGLPPQLNLNLNIPIQLPPSLNPQQLPAEVTQLLQQLQQTMLVQIRNLISEEIKKQLPIIGIDTKGEKIVWKEVKDSLL